VGANFSISKGEEEMQFEADRDFYPFVDRLTIRLADAGMTDAAKQLHTLLHETAWTTSSELLGEIRAVLIAATAQHHRQIPQPLLQDIHACINTINKAWTKANEG
jgi:hypothetical protein